MQEDEDQWQLDQLSRELHQRDRSREPTKMAEIMSQLLARRGYLQTLAANDLAQAWRECAGSSMAQYTRVGQLRRGTLEVFVEDSTSMQELTFQKQQLLAKLKQLAPDHKISNLRLSAGPIR